MNCELPHISVIVPVYNEGPYLSAFLDALLEQDYPRDRVEFLLVDGESSDGTRELLLERADADPCLVVLDNPDTYVPFALNLGLSQANGEVIVRMDVHAIYPSDYITRLVAWLETTGADNVGGVWRTLPGGPGARAEAIARALASPFGVGNAAYRTGVDRPLEVDTVPFGCYPREVFSRIGGFDPDLLRNQDDEFNARLQRAGGRIMLIPEIEISYFARTTFRSLARMMYQYGFFKPLVNKKLGRPATLRQFFPPGLVLGLGCALLMTLALPRAWPLPAGLLLGYAGFLLAGALRSGPGLRIRILTAAAMAIMHLSYGAGYLQGILVHLLLRRKQHSVPGSR